MPIVAPSPFGWIVFRADTRAPLTIYANGFTPRINRGGIDVQLGGQMIGGVSTTRDISIATRYAGNYDGYVYVMFAEKGVDIVAYLVKAKAAKSAITNALSQQELAVAAIPGVHIIGARKARSENSICKFSGLINVNPNCTVDESLQEAGFAYLEADIQVSSEYNH